MVRATMLTLAAALAMAAPDRAPAQQTKPAPPADADFIPPMRGMPDGRISGGTRGIKPLSTPVAPSDDASHVPPPAKARAAPARRARPGESVTH